MAFYGRPSLPFASPKTLQTPKTPKRPLQWLLMGFQRRQKPTSMAFYGRPSLPFASPKTLQTPKTPQRPLQWLLMGFLKPLKGHFNGFLWASSAGKSPHPWLFMGVQACRLPALKRSKPLKPLKGHFNGFLWASSAGKSYPKARCIAFSGRSSVPLARHSQRTGIPRPHPWLFMGVQACRLPALKRSKPLKPLKGHFNGFLWASSAGKSAHPWLFMGVQACRLPALKRSKPLKPLKGHFNGFLWASSAGKSYPKARSIAVSGRSSVPFARHSQPTGIPRPHPWLFMDFQRKQKLPQGQIHCFFWAVQRPVGQAFAANRHPKATSMAFYGRPSLPFASPKTLQTPKTPKRPLQWLLMGFQRRQKLPQGQIHCCFWAVQRAVRQAFAANGHPKATSMASYGLPAQAKATPRPDPLLFLGGPACRWPGIRSEQASQGHIHGFLWASKLAVCQP